MRKILAPITGLASYLLIAKSAFAADGVTIKICTDAAQNPILDAVCRFKADTFGQIVGNIIIAIIIIAIVIALIFLIIGGIKWITSGGDKSKVESARNTIVAAIVGLVITLLAYFIISFVLSIFGIDNIAEIKIPPLVK